MSTENFNNLHFIEEQRFTQWWLWVLLIGIALIPVYGTYQQLYLGIPMGSKPLPDIGMILFLLFMLGFLAFFWMLKLTTEIDKEGIKMNYFPFTDKALKWEEVKSAEVLDYGFVGGWGVRIGTKYGTVYNTSGKMGVALILKNGKKICIGTQRVEEMKKIVEDAKELGVF